MLYSGDDGRTGRAGKEGGSERGLKEGEEEFRGSEGGFRDLLGCGV
jgi:hypothetical protein